MGSINKPPSHHHFLVVTIAAQGQITPARHLARRLSRTAGARVTVATPLSSHRRMFSSSTAVDDDEGLVSFAPYSDGFDDGFHPDSGDGDHFMARLKLVGTQTLTHLAHSLAAAGHPVTCVIYTILSAWAADVAWDLGVPSVAFFIQPAAVLSIFYHYFHRDSADVISSNIINNPSFVLELPGLPPLSIRDLPSMLAAPSPYLAAYGEIFEALERERERRGGMKPKILMNTFYTLEADTIAAIGDLDLISIGPLVEKDVMTTKDLFEQDKSEYMEWLETQEERSVVYISFGSLSRLSKGQMEEISKGLEGSGRPYLWVVRKDIRLENGISIDEYSTKKKGMTVEWCDQVRVLSHRAVGCFVTHCGWNSTVESMLCGVPTVMMPQWMDQATNARLMEGAWGVGVRGEVNGEGVVEGGELKRCLDLVMGGEERGVEIRKRAEMWKEKARYAIGEDGPSVRSLAGFVDGF